MCSTNPDDSYVVFPVTPTHQSVAEFYQSGAVRQGMKRALGDRSPSPERVDRVTLLTTVNDSDHTVVHHHKRIKSIIASPADKVLLRLPLEMGVGQLFKDRK